MRFFANATSFFKYRFIFDEHKSITPYKHRFIVFQNFLAGDILHPISDVSYLVHVIKGKGKPSLSLAFDSIHEISDSAYKE